ncbi:MAG: response regulator transcription factor [Chamaesiphon sp.]
MIHILLVDDQSIICQGLGALLQLEPDLQVVGTANNGLSAIEQVEALHPDVVLMDIRMPVMDGVTATQAITQRFPKTKVLGLSTFDDDEYIAEALKAGAKGYLLKDMPSEELADAVRSIQKGYAQLGSGIFEKFVSRVINVGSVFPEKNLSEFTELTPREQDVLRLIGVGSTNREIAQKLHISEGTVKTHVTNILSRLNLKNRSQLAIYANSVNWDSQPPES